MFELGAREPVAIAECGEHLFRGSELRCGNGYVAGKGREAGASSAGDRLVERGHQPRWQGSNKRQDVLCAAAVTEGDGGVERFRPNQAGGLMSHGEALAQLVKNNLCMAERLGRPVVRVRGDRSDGRGGGAVVEALAGDERLQLLVHRVRCDDVAAPTGNSGYARGEVLTVAAHSRELGEQLLDSIPLARE